MANTTNLNLVKLAGSETIRSFPSSFNDNMEKIDTGYGTLNNRPSAPMKNLTNINSLSALTTALNSELDNLSNLSIEFITFSAGASFDVFLNGERYYMMLQKGGTSTYATVYVSWYGSTTSYMGKKGSSGWSFTKILNEANFANYFETQTFSVSGFDGTSKETTLTLTDRTGFTPVIITVSSNTYGPSNCIKFWGQGVSNKLKVYVEHNLSSSATTLYVYILWVAS